SKPSAVASWPCAGAGNYKKSETALNDTLTGATVSGRPKTLAEAKQWMLARLAKRIHPMNSLPADEGVQWIQGVPGLDGKAWGEYWEALGLGILEQARAAEHSGNTGLASQLFQKASGVFFMGRFPCPNHPAKVRCAVAERDAYVKGARYWQYPVNRVVIPFDGRQGEGKEIVLLERRPAGQAPFPVVVVGVRGWGYTVSLALSFPLAGASAGEENSCRARGRPPGTPRSALARWGGVDAYKEQMTAASDAFLAQGVATIAMDNAGTGESPVK